MMFPHPSPAVNGVIFWVSAACCVVAQVALIYSAIRAPMAGSPQSASMRMPSRASEVAWTVVPAVALVVLLVFTWQASHQPAATPDPHAGHQMIDE